MAAILDFGGHVGFCGEIDLALYPHMLNITKPTLVPNFMLFTKIEQFSCMGHILASLRRIVGLIEINIAY